MGKCMRVRYNPFKYVSNDIVIRIDGTIKILKSLSDIISEFVSGNFDMYIMPHPKRFSFIDEYNEWIAWRNYPLDQAHRCLCNMSMDGYDFNYKGLYQTGFCIIKKSQKINDFHKFIFEYLKKCEKPFQIERIDQIIFSFILNQYFKDSFKILPVSEQILQSKYMQSYYHGNDIKNNGIWLVEHGDITKPDYHYMFNELVECKYFL